MKDVCFRSLGFNFSSWEEFMTVARSRDWLVLTTNPLFAHVFIYPDPSGPNICLFETSDGDSGESFTAPGIGGHAVDIFQIRPGVAHIDLLDESGELETRFLALVDDPQKYPEYPLKAVGPPAHYEDYLLGAVGIDLKVYDSVSEWVASQEPIGPDGMFLGPSFITSPWLFGLYGGQVTAAEANPTTIFKAECKEVEIRTNALTGMSWYWIVADCGFTVGLAAPIDLSPAPKPGSVVDGTVFLTGSVGYPKKRG